MKVFNPGAVPVVTAGGHVVPAGEWADAPDPSEQLEAGLLIADEAEPDPELEPPAPQAPKPKTTTDKPKEGGR